MDLLTTFSLTNAQLIAIASLVNAGTRDPYPPILGGIQLTVTPSTVTATATDRYVAAELSFPLGETEHTIPDEGVSIVIDSPNLVALAKEKCGFTFTFTQDEGAYPITAEGDANGVVRTFPNLAGNFPPVARLFYEDATDDLPNGIVLNLAYLGRLSKLLLPGEKTAAAAGKNPWTMSYRNSHKHAPVMLTRENGMGSYRALIQPNLKVS